MTSLTKKQERFVESWASLGSSWGINRTMAQIFALLLVTDEEFSVVEIMDTLGISRGNVSMNVKVLQEWGLIRRKVVKGKRKEFFEISGSVWELTKRVSEERKRREVNPLINELKEIQKMEKEENDEKTDIVISEIFELYESLNKILELINKFDDVEMSKRILRPLIKKLL